MKKSIHKVRITIDPEKEKATEKMMKDVINASVVDNQMYSAMMEYMRKTGEAFGKIQESLTNSIVQSLKDQIASITTIYAPVIESLKASLEQNRELVELQKELNNLNEQLSESRKATQKIEKLGSFGWAIIPHKDFYGYDAPDNQQEADEYMLSLMTDEKESAPDALS